MQSDTFRIHPARAGSSSIQPRAIKARTASLGRVNSSFSGSSHQPFGAGYGLIPVSLGAGIGALVELFLVACWLVELTLVPFGPLIELVLVPFGISRCTS